MSRITDSIICVSDFDKQLALKYRFNRLKLTTIHNGIADVPAVKQTLKANHITILAKLLECCLINKIYRLMTRQNINLL